MARRAPRYPFIDLLNGLLPAVAPALRALLRRLSASSWPELPRHGIYNYRFQLSLYLGTNGASPPFVSYGLYGQRGGPLGGGPLGGTAISEVDVSVAPPSPQVSSFSYLPGSPPVRATLHVSDRCVCPCSTS